MFHESAKYVNSALNPIMNDTFITKTNINVKGQGVLEFGVKYIINGFGKGKPNDSGERKEFWEIIDKYNTEVPPIHLWKEDLNKLYKKKIIKLI